MKITAESTSKIVTLEVDGTDIPARIWEAETEKGVKCHLYVTRVAVHESEDDREFQRELVLHRTPSVEIQEIPLRLII